MIGKLSTVDFPYPLSDSMTKYNIFTTQEILTFLFQFHVIFCSVLLLLLLLSLLSLCQPESCCCYLYVLRYTISSHISKITIPSSLTPLFFLLYNNIESTFSLQLPCPRERSPHWKDISRLSVFLNYWPASISKELLESIQDQPVICPEFCHLFNCQLSLSYNFRLLRSTQTTHH